MSNIQELFLKEHVNELAFAIEGTHSEMLFRAALKCAQHGIDERIIRKRLKRAAVSVGLCREEAAQAISDALTLVKA